MMTWTREAKVEILRSGQILSAEASGKASKMVADTVRRVNLLLWDLWRFFSNCFNFLNDAEAKS